MRKAALILCVLTFRFAAAVPQAPMPTTVYDRFHDWTKIAVEIRPGKVSDPSTNSTLVRIPLSIEFVCPGQKTKCRPSRVLVSYAAGWQSLARCDSLDVIFMADGARFPRGQCRWLGSTVMFDLEPDDLAVFGKAKELEAKIGLWIFTFDEGSGQGIRSLAEHIEMADESPKTEPASAPESPVASPYSGASGGAFRTGVNGVNTPICLYCPLPQYSAEARKVKYQGTVVLQVTITSDGRAIDISVLKGPGLGLEEKAIEAVKGWKFKPAVGPNGKVVPSTVPLEVTFRSAD